MSLKKSQQLGNMANAKKKKRAMRSVRSGVKTAQLIKTNQETIYNIWTYLNVSQLSLRNGSSISA